MAINREFPEGVRGMGLKLISDNGSQPTAASFMRDMVEPRIENRERVISTIKEGLQQALCSLST